LVNVVQHIFLFKFSENKYKYKKLCGGFINFYPDKIWHSVFPHKFNFAVEPSVGFNVFYFVRLAIDKNDFEYGSNIIVKLNENLKVVDLAQGIVDTIKTKAQQRV
jgi:hypothetical protein